MEEKPNAARHATPPRTPAWVKVFFVVVVLLILIVVIAHLTGLRFDHGGTSGLISISMSHLSIPQIL